MLDETLGALTATIVQSLAARFDLAPRAAHRPLGAGGGVGGVQVYHGKGLKCLLSLSPTLGSRTSIYSHWPFLAFRQCLQRDIKAFRAVDGSVPLDPALPQGLKGRAASYSFVRGKCVRTLRGKQLIGSDLNIQFAPCWECREHLCTRVMSSILLAILPYSYLHIQICRL